MRMRTLTLAALALCVVSCARQNPVELRSGSPEYILCQEDQAEMTLENLNAYSRDIGMLAGMYDAANKDEGAVNAEEAETRIASMTLNVRNVLRDEQQIDATAKEVLEAMIIAFPEEAPRGELKYAETGGMLLTLTSQGYSLDSAAVGVKGVVGALYRLGK